MFKNRNVWYGSRNDNLFYLIPQNEAERVRFGDLRGHATDILETIDRYLKYKTMISYYASTEEVKVAWSSKVPAKWYASILRSYGAPLLGYKIFIAMDRERGSVACFKINSFDAFRFHTIGICTTHFISCLL